MLESSPHGVPKEQWQRTTVLFSELLLSTSKEDFAEASWRTRVRLKVP